VFKIRTKHLNTFLDDFAEQHLSRVGKWIVTGDIRAVEGSRTGKMGSFWAGGKKEVYDEISSFRSVLDLMSTMMSKEHSDSRDGLPCGDLYPYQG